MEHDLNSTDSGVIGLHIDSLIHTYLTHHNIKDFTKYVFHLTIDRLPNFTEWDYPVEKPTWQQLISFENSSTHTDLKNKLRTKSLPEWSSYNKVIQNYLIDNDIFNFNEYDFCFEEHDSYYDSCFNTPRRIKLTKWNYNIPKPDFHRKDEADKKINRTKEELEITLEDRYQEQIDILKRDFKLEIEELKELLLQQLILHRQDIEDQFEKRLSDIQQPPKRFYAIDKKTLNSLKSNP
jgi:hypothetical protein